MFVYRFVVVAGIGNVSFRKVALDRMIVCNMITLPYRERCFLDSCCNCFSIFVRHSLNF